MRLTVGFVLFTLFVMTASASSEFTLGNGGTFSISRLGFDHVIVIMMENHSLNGTFGVINQTNAPYIYSLAQNNALAQNYYDVSTNGSLPQYMGITSGNVTYATDCLPPGPTCPLTSSQSIADSLESAALTWKAYMENMTTPCQSTSVSYYVPDHNPFVYYKKIASNAVRCNTHVVPAGGSAGTDSQFLSDMNNPAAFSNYIWLSPNNCNDMHNDCTLPLSQTSVCGSTGMGNDTNCMRQGDSYLNALIPKIMSSSIWATGRTALFITWDEPFAFTGHSICPNKIPTNPAGGNTCQAAGIWVGPMVKSMFRSNTFFTHYSLLATVEDNWGLASLVLSTDGSAALMSSFFM